MKKTNIMFSGFYFIKDEWLSECLSVSCFNLTTSQGLEFENLPLNEAIFISAKLNENAKHGLDNMGFRSINTQVTYRKKLTKNSEQSFFEEKQNRELEFVGELENAENFAPLFIYDRFSRDSDLPADWSFRIKNKWLQDAAGTKRFVIARVNQNVAGFILFKPGKECVIELVCVRNEYRGQGVSKKLLQALEDYCINQKCESILVGTQGDNQVSMSLYERFGFKVESRKHILHYSKGLN